MRGSGSLGGDKLSTRLPRRPRRRGLLPPRARGAQPAPPLALLSRGQLAVSPSPGAAPRFPAAPGPASRSPPALRPCPPRARGTRGLGTRSPQSHLLVARSFPGFPCWDRLFGVFGLTCGQEVAKSWNSLVSPGRGVKVGPESLLLLRPSPVSLKAALLGGHAGCRERGQGKCPTLPPPRAGLGGHFPREPRTPPPCSGPGLGTPAKRVYGTGRPGTGVEPVEKVLFLFTHTHTEARLLHAGSLAQVFAVLSCPHSRPGGTPFLA